MALQSSSCLAVLKPWLWTGAHGDLGTDTSGFQIVMGEGEQVRALREAETGSHSFSKGTAEMLFYPCIHSAKITLVGCRKVNLRTQWHPRVALHNQKLLNFPCDGVTCDAVASVPLCILTAWESAALEKLLPKEILLLFLIDHVTCPRDDFYPVSWEDKWSWRWDRSSGHQNGLCW